MSNFQEMDKKLKEELKNVLDGVFDSNVTVEDFEESLKSLGNVLDKGCSCLDCQEARLRADIAETSFVEERGAIEEENSQKEDLDNDPGYQRFKKAMNQVFFGDPDFLDKAEEDKSEDGLSGLLKEFENFMKVEDSQEPTLDEGRDNLNTSVEQLAYVLTGTVDGIITRASYESIAEGMIPLIKGFLVMMGMVEVEDFQGYGQYRQPTEKEQLFAEGRRAFAEMCKVTKTRIDEED